MRQPIKAWLLFAAAFAVCIAAACAPPPSGSPKDCTVRAPFADLRGCDLRDADFGVAMDLHGADLRGANLAGVTFGNNDFGDPDLVGHFEDVRFDGANMTDARFTNFTNFTGASFVDTDLRHANFDFQPGTGSLTFGDNDFTRADLTNASGDEFEIPDSNFTDARFEHFSCIQGGLSGTFTGADFDDSFFGFVYALTGTLDDTSFRNVQFVDGLYDGNFTGADFSGADFGVIQLRGNFTGANLTGTSFTATTVGPANFTNADLTGATLDTVEPPTFTGITWSNTTCPNGTVQSTACF